MRPDACQEDRIIMDQRTFFDQMRALSARVNLRQEEAERLAAETITAVRAGQPLSSILAEFQALLEQERA
jgi:type II secretory pathway component PulM